MSIDRRILIADDDSEVRLGAAELLAPMGLEVLQAASGSEALDLVRASRLHLCVLDVHMPGATGPEVLAAIQKDELDVPCILWSGDATDEVARYLVQTGASAFLRKPVKPDLLRGEVTRVLESRWGELN